MMRLLRIVLLAALSLAGLSVAGCSSGGATAATGSSTRAATPDQAVQQRLNDPNVSEQEKAMIRQNMAGSSGVTGAGGNPAGSGR